MDRGFIIKLFPGLEHDEKFKVSSPEDTNYNCIAWAYKLFQDRWMQPPNGAYIPMLDAISWWPDCGCEDMSIRSLVAAFESVGFISCSGFEHEKGYIKVALYWNPLNGRWTHAARESRSGDYWMSKLGVGNDIQHKDPMSIEGDTYGKVFCFMKKEG